MSVNREKLEHRVANELEYDKIYRLKVVRYLILNGIEDLIPARMKEEASKYVKDFTEEMQILKAYRMIKEYYPDEKDFAIMPKNNWDEMNYRFNNEE
jgi:hypothetical protein